MAFKALITFDLPKATDVQRNLFYDVLIKKNWIKIEDVSTSWKLKLPEGVSRENCQKTIKKNLLEAKEISKIGKSKYASMISESDVLEDVV